MEESSTMKTEKLLKLLDGQVFDPLSLVIAEASEDENNSASDMEAILNKPSYQTIIGLGGIESNLHNMINVRGFTSYKKKKEYIFPEKPIPFAVPMEKIFSIYEDLCIKEKKPIVKYFYMFEYLFAARVNENLNVRRQDIEIVDDYEGNEYLSVLFLNQKNRSRTAYARKTLTPLKGLESKYVNMLLNEYIDKFDGLEKLFNFTRTTAWEYISDLDFGPLQVFIFTEKKRGIEVRNVFPGYNHYLRHCRLTHLKQYYGFDDHMLKEAVGWTDIRPAATYVHMDSRDYMNAFKKVNRTVKV